MRQHPQFDADCLYGGGNIDTSCVKSIGGVLDLLVANLSEIDTVTYNATPGDYLNAVDTFALAPGAFLYRLRPLRTTGSGLTEAQGVGGGGAINYNETVTGQLAGMTQFNRNLFDSFVGASLVAFVKMREQDANTPGAPKWFVYGLEGGLLGSGSMTTGAADADLSGFTITMTGTTTVPARQFALAGDPSTANADLEALVFP